MGASLLLLDGLALRAVPKALASENSVVGAVGESTSANTHLYAGPE